ncbi:MAG: coproporphyrinogen dehydrogenase HemZ, partial [Oscillospiraceae bacterium]|nr:coproporphyrinogen dehydrogenase HemZ [Oscillospiraceae bacterium]
YTKDLSVQYGKKEDFAAENDVLYIGKDGDNVSIEFNFNGGIYTDSVSANADEDKMMLDICAVLYRIYTKAFGKTLAWGMLTGVRPVRLMRNLYAKHEDIDTVTDIFKNQYFVSDEKIKLCKDIFTLQKGIIDSCKPNDYSLYISIPFCPTRCSYCSFVSVGSTNATKLMEQYVQKLCEEIKYTAKTAQKAKLNLKTIYIGGGTPTAVSADQLKTIMQTVKDNFDLSKVQEYTVEAGRPDCTTREKLHIIKDFGADRVSINPQTFSDDVLRAIGRKHTYKDFLDCYNMAKQIGFKSINTDLIAGLPLDTVEGFENSLKGCIELGAENITVHTLTLKRASNIVVDKQDNSYSDVARMIEKNALLGENGYIPYYMYRQKSTLQSLENVGFSQPGHESLYNIYIMEEIQTIISCGAGGVTKVVGPNGELKRIYNYKYPTEYIKDFDVILQRKDEVTDVCRQFGFLND